MKRTTTILVIALTAVSVTALGAAARERGPDFSALDTDGNGELTQTELQAHGAARFAETDKDGDGLLSAAEIAAHAEQRAAARADRMVERLDTDGDGLLSTEELAARRGEARIFQRMDTDDSGTITKAEFDAARERMRAHFGGRTRGE